MSHPKDTDQRNQPAAADDATDLMDDLVLVDLLYGELDGSARQRAEQRMREDDALAGELEALSRIRSIMRELPDEEPPEVISTKLLHAAAAEVAGNRALAGDDDRPSVWERLRRLFMPLMMHPGLAAAASVILVGGVAGMLYLSNRLEVASPVAREAGAPAEMAAATPSAAAGAPQRDVGAPQTTAGATPPEGAVAAATEPGPDITLGRGGARGQALDEAPEASETGAQKLRLDGAARRPPTNAELALEDFGAEEQRQGYFAQAPAEDPAAPPLAHQGKAGRAASTTGDADTADLPGSGELDKNASRSTRRSRDEAKQKKEAEAYRLAQPPATRSKADDVAGYDELTSQLESGSSAGAGSRNAPGASGGAAGGAPAQAAPREPAPAKTAPAKKPSPEPAATPPPPPPASDRAPESDAEAAAPADGKKVAAREDNKERARKDSSSSDQGDKGARISALHKQALAAAARGDCATVRTTSSTIRSLDPTYHRDRVARDERLQDCLAVKKK
jgi:hypothetical protein